MTNPVVHFEMPAKDKKRVAEFYSKALGWDMQVMGPEMGNYVLAITTPMGENNRPKDPGAINGGFFEYKDEEGYNAPHLVISVSDLNKSIEDVKAAGGEIIGEPMDIPGVGNYVSFKDTEGNRVGLLQPSPQM
jgi:uncharacterized protein